jgi:hypothetical protein
MHYHKGHWSRSLERPKELRRFAAGAESSLARKSRFLCHDDWLCSVASRPTGPTIPAAVRLSRITSLSQHVGDQLYATNPGGQMDGLSIIRNLIAQVSSSAVIVTIASFLFWKADNVLSDAGRKYLYEGILNIAKEPNNPRLQESIQHFLARYYSRNLSPLAFAGFLLAFSMASLLILLCIYIAVSPGLFEQLLIDSAARARFFGYLTGNGLIVVLAVNFFGYFHDQYRLGKSDDPSLLDISHVFLTGMLLKVSLFVVVTAAVYVAFATYGDSFLGSPMLALQSVPATILYGIAFQNLTGVFLYSTAISSFPIFIVALIRVLSSHPHIAAIAHATLFFLNFENRPIRALSVLLGIFLAFFAFLVFTAASLFHIFF